MQGEKDINRKILREKIRVQESTIKEVQWSWRLAYILHWFGDWISRWPNTYCLEIGISACQSWYAFESHQICLQLLILYKNPLPERKSCSRHITCQHSQPYASRPQSRRWVSDLLMLFISWRKRISERTNWHVKTCWVSAIKWGQPDQSVFSWTSAKILHFTMIFPLSGKDGKTKQKRYISLQRAF